MDTHPDNKTLPPFVFFGSSQFSIYVLDELDKLGFKPALIVTTPDKPQGRKLVMTPNVVKAWAIDHDVSVLTPDRLDDRFVEGLEIGNWKLEIFIVASYGKILPKALIDLPAHKTLNIHPSLLPRYRGASPLQAAMLDDVKQTGVTIMRIDEEMDHGPIVAQRDVDVSSAFGEWPTYERFEEHMAREGAQLLAETMPGWVSGAIREREQDHGVATYTKKTRKEDGLIDLSGDSYANFRKIQAYHQWPQAYFMISKGGADMRVKVTAASFADGKLTIENVIPEGGKEMTYTDFTNGYGETRG